MRWPRATGRAQQNEQDSLREFLEGGLNRTVDDDELESFMQVALGANSPAPSEMMDRRVLAASPSEFGHQFQITFGEVTRSGVRPVEVNSNKRWTWRPIDLPAQMAVRFTPAHPNELLQLLSRLEPAIVDQEAGNFRPPAQHRHTTTQGLERLRVQLGCPTQETVVSRSAQHGSDMPQTILGWATWRRRGGDVVKASTLLHPDVQIGRGRHAQQHRGDYKRILDGITAEVASGGAPNRSFWSGATKVRIRSYSRTSRPDASASPFLVHLHALLDSPSLAGINMLAAREQGHASDQACEVIDALTSQGHAVTTVSFHRGPSAFRKEAGRRRERSNDDPTVYTGAVVRFRGLDPSSSRTEVELVTSPHVQGDLRAEVVRRLKDQGLIGEFAIQTTADFSCRPFADPNLRDLGRRSLRFPDTEMAMPY